MRRVVLLLGSLAFLTLAASASGLAWPDVSDRIERDLHSPDPATRRSAARELSTLGTSRATSLVLEAMSDSDVDVRLAGAQSAVRLQIAPAADVVIQWLGEREVRLRIAACEVANAIPTPRVVQQLARALGDSDPQVRAACAEALGAQGSTEAVPPLSGKVDNPTPAVRSQVARALARLGDPRAVVPLVGKVQDSAPDVRQAVIRALGELADTRATQALLLALRDNVSEVKVEALAALGRLRAPETASAVASLALDRNPTIRQAALLALGRIATPDAIRALANALGTQDDSGRTLERTSVRDALVSAGAPAVIELTSLLGRPVSASVATGAAWVLGELHAKESAPSIVAALRKGALPASAALRALAGAGGAEQVPVVLEFLADPSPAVREEALRAATALLDPSYPDGRAVEPLAATLRAPRATAGERAAAATLLGRTGAPRATAILAGLVSSKDAALRLAAIDALGALRGVATESKHGDGTADGALVPLLTDTDSAVRLHAAVALAASGGIEARAALLSNFDRSSEVDRYCVLTALGGILARLPDEKVAARLFRELSVAAGPERDAIIEAAGRARLRSVLALLADVAAAGDADDRRAIAAVLAAHRGAPAAVALAQSLAGDPDPTVRAQAAFTLGAVGDPAVLAQLARLAQSGDADVAVNAVGGIARYALLTGKISHAAVAAVACTLLADGRSGVRANALVALSFARARCGDGRTERRLLTADSSDLVRSAAARAVVAAQAPEDGSALDRCTSNDRSVEVAMLCRPRRRSEVPASPKAPRAVTVFIMGESGLTAKPLAPFLLEYEGGILHAGVADRRGAAFEALAPAGDVSLRRRPPR